MALTMATGPSIGPVFFDAVFSTTHNANVTVTTQPVQVGANISDHAYVEPDSVTLEIGMSDAAEGAGANHSVNAYTMLRAVMEAREPISLYTRLKCYTNMMVVSISVTDDVTTSTALKANIMLQKILIVNVATVQVQQTVTASKSESSGSSSSKSSSKKSTSTKKSSSSSSSKKKSVLKQIADKSKTSAAKTSTKSVSKTNKTTNSLIGKAVSKAKSKLSKS